MGKIDNFVEGLIALFILFIFGSMVLPVLAQTTGQSVFLLYLSLIMVGVGIVFSIIKLFMGSSYGRY